MAVVSGISSHSAPKIMRNMRIVALNRAGWRKDHIGRLVGISGGRVGQIVKQYERQGRQAWKKLQEFKVEECAREILAIKRAYDALPDDEKKQRKDEMAEQIDVLLAHLRDAEAKAARHH